ncbi:MAG TPA: ABC transporter permease [Nitrososphaerales archaeon]|nr:ABC transporter permease [Nitrososphaerales archaeon]
MGLSDLVDHMMRRPIRATGQVSEQTEKKEEKEVQVKEGAAFYFDYMRKDKGALGSMVVIVAFLAFGLVEGILQYAGSLFKDTALGWAILPSDPLSSTATTFKSSLQPPSLVNFPANVLGTNFQGQSILSRLMYATPHDAAASLVVVGSAILVGMFLGTASGYFGGWVDEVMMRLTDAFLALPGLVLAITVAVLIGGGFTALLYALTLIWWPTYARFFRAQALTLRNKGYVEAAKLNGTSSLKILVKHIIPNSVDPVIAYATLDMGTVILTIAALAFLGIGVSSGYPEWGAESSAGLQFFPQQWWYAIMPGLLIGIIVVSFTLVGDRLQDLIGGRITY